LFNKGVIPESIIDVLKEIPFPQREVIQQAIDYTLAPVGKSFDKPIAVPLLLTLKITEGKQHCSGLVRRAYKAVGVDLDSNDGLHLYPDDIYSSPKLKLL